MIKDYIDALGRNGSNGTAIYYMRKIFRKTHISYPLIDTSTLAYQGVRNSIFRKTLRTY